MRTPTPFARILRDTLKLITLHSLCICSTYSKPTTWIWTHKQNDGANKTNKERNACELYRKFIHLIVPTPYLWTIACLKTTHCSNCYIKFSWSRCVFKIEGFHLLPTLIYLQCSFIRGDINNHKGHGICTVILITFLLPQ